jgi:hypothetical protein
MFCKSCGVADGMMPGAAEDVCRPCHRMLSNARILSQPQLHEALLRQSLEAQCRPTTQWAYGDYLGIGLAAYPIGRYG